MSKQTLQLAALSDIHWGRDSNDEMRSLLSQASNAADVLLICGDLTNYGLPEEARLLAEDLHAHVRIPILAVLGNHDFESGQAHKVREILTHAGVKLLNGECVEVGGVGFAGVSGFGGGFGRRMLNAWGEPLIKQFVQATVDEALKLEKALSSLHTEQRVALLHYAPIRETVAGEPPELFPFLGSSRLEEPLNRYGVKVAFHGHAHAGTPEGMTSSGIPVYNVSVPVLRRAYPEAPPFRLLEVEVL